ncbi:MAG: exonuclease SbcCD subunit D [Nitrososphaerota archaeon]|jgi:exonuclease SbcD|nr:exonuclease SbcCD subunit D [Nitrososphaerota archaeon]
MKFLHLSDLHIGKSVNGVSMIDEQKHIFQQILHYIQSEQVNAVVIAGDIYDTSLPRTEAIRVFDDFLTDLAQKNVAVLIVAGNHDSPERISYANRLLIDKQLFLCGSFAGSLQKVTFTDEHGEIKFWLLPFIKPLLAQNYFREHPIETYDDALTAVIKTTNIDYNTRNVFVSHQFFTKSGVEPIRSDSEQNPVGGLDAINTSIIEKFDYVALGHLHGTQKVGVENIRYAGSPLKYSSSESHQTKSILLVELKEKNSNIMTKTLILTPLHDMRKIKGKLETLISEQVSSLANKEDYLHVVLTDEEELIDPMGKLRSVYPNVMSLDFENSRTKNKQSETYLSLEQTKQLSPFELFCKFFHKSCGSEMSQEQERIVRGLLETEATE